MSLYLFCHCVRSVSCFRHFDHSSITDLLSTSYGIALEWFVSDQLMDCSSSLAEVACGFPQGFRPRLIWCLLSTLRPPPLSYVIQRHNVKHYLHADDTHIYSSLSLKITIFLEILTKCLQGVSSWMSSRKLKLNPDRTEFLLIGSKVKCEIFSKCFPTRLLAQEVTPSPTARNLGVVFDRALNFKLYIWYNSRLLLSYT